MARTWLITGCSSGFGKVLAHAVAARGDNLVATARGTDDLGGLAERHPGTVRLAALDVTKEGSAAAAVAVAVARDAFGGLDVLVNNAGVEMHNKLTADLTPDDWETVFAVDVKGVFLCMKHEIAAMRKTGGGAIVNNSSMNGLVAIPHATEYTAAKHAVNGATRGAASEARETGVRVNAVLPGLIETPMIDRLQDEPGFKDHYASALERHSVGRFGKPEDVGYAVRWLLSDEASFVNGAMIAVDGGYTAR